MRPCVELGGLDTNALIAAVDGDGAGEPVTAARISVGEVLAAERSGHERELRVLARERDYLERGCCGCAGAPR